MEANEIIDENASKLIGKRIIDGKVRIVYRCSRCNKPAIYSKEKKQGEVLCKACRLADNNAKRKQSKVKKATDPKFDASKFHYKEYDELDHGMVVALYKARRSIKWIADDLCTKESTVVRILRERSNSKNQSGGVVVQNSLARKSG